MQNRLYISFTIRTLCEYVACVETESQMVNACVSDTKESPHQLLFKLTYHALQQAYLCRHLFAIVAIAGNLNNF